MDYSALQNQSFNTHKIVQLSERIGHFTLNGKQLTDSKFEVLQG